MSKIDKELISENVECTQEKVHRVISALISCTPTVGGVLDKAFNSTFKSPMAVRHQQWMELVTDAINEIFERSDTTAQDLLSNGEFLDAYMQSSLIALKHRQEERREFLKNALVNTVLTPFDPSGKEQALLQFIDDFTVWHFKILSFYMSPMTYIDTRNYVGEQSEGTMFYIKSAMPELSKDDSFLYLIWSDLKGNGLIVGGSPYELRFIPPEEANEAITSLSSYVTPLGISLMKFISHEMNVNAGKFVERPIIKPR